ncbi:hypothetical protein KY289_026768 [Solanum tuberosum]|nr:hypothetical protein KY289_026768 [Solanum tuberosum]
MKKKYQGSTRVKRAHLQAMRKDFETLEMKEGESVTNYCARTIEITNKMRFHGENIDDIGVVGKILRFLTSKYNYVFYVIEESKDIDELSPDELQRSKRSRLLLILIPTTIEEEVEVEAEEEEEESWNGRKPTVDHFRILGCIAYAHVPDERRKKLDDKAENDVTFDEESTWDWNRQQPTQILFDSDVEQEKFSAPYVLKNSSVSTPTTPPFVVVANEEATQNLGNVRRRPAWIKDSKIVILHLLRVP